jgi:hypothetical protein
MNAPRRQLFFSAGLQPGIFFSIRGADPAPAGSALSLQEIDGFWNLWSALRVFINGQCFMEARRAGNSMY